MAEQIVTVSEAAKLREVGPGVIRYWLRKGWLTSARKAGGTWIMSRAEVLDFEPPKPGPRRLIDKLEVDD